MLNKRTIGHSSWKRLAVQLGEIIGLEDCSDTCVSICLPHPSIILPPPPHSHSPRNTPHSFTNLTVKGRQGCAVTCPQLMPFLSLMISSSSVLSCLAFLVDVKFQCYLSQRRASWSWYYNWFTNPPYGWRNSSWLYCIIWTVFLAYKHQIGPRSVCKWSNSNENSDCPWLLTRDNL